MNRQISLMFENEKLPNYVSGTIFQPPTSNQFFACHVPRKIGTKVNLHYASYFSSGVRVAYLERWNGPWPGRVGGGKPLKNSCCYRKNIRWYHSYIIYHISYITLFHSDVLIFGSFSIFGHCKSWMRLSSPWPATWMSSKPAFPWYVRPLFIWN